MFKKLTHWVFPGCCCLCDGLGHAGLDLCNVCLSSLLKNLSCCSRCASPVVYAKPNKHLVCGSCLTEKPLFKQAFAPYIFDYPVDYFVRSLKFNYEEKYARLMGQLLALNVRNACLSMPECIVPVPLHRQRYIERGFNQAALIAQFCALRLGLPIVENLVERVQHTPPQTGLGRELRKKNLTGAFEVIDSAQMPKHIVLIDDVITTGSTVSEISRVLTSAGVERVDVWAFSRAVNQRSYLRS